MRILKAKDNKKEYEFIVINSTDVEISKELKNKLFLFGFRVGYGTDYKCYVRNNHIVLEIYKTIYEPDFPLYKTFLENQNFKIVKIKKEGFKGSNYNIKIKAVKEFEIV